MGFEVETQNLEGRVTTVGSAFWAHAGDRSPGRARRRRARVQRRRVLLLAVAGCVSNDLFREARAKGIALTRVRIVARGDFGGNPPVSQGIEFDVEIRGRASEAQLQSLVREVDAIAEIPNSLRRATAVRLGAVRAARE